MLRHLSIRNYTLIEQVEMDFTQGFTVITGETGAGKSILLGALNLILGQRADTKVLLDKQNKCIVEGTFDIGGYELAHLFETFDWDYSAQTVIRREILPSGKSRAFVNDTPALLENLQMLSRELIDIHSQHQSLFLSNRSFPFLLIDRFAGIEEEVKTYDALRKKYLQTAAEIRELGNRLEREKEQRDYRSFLLDELRKADFHEGEQETLENELEKGEHAEKIARILHESYYRLYESEQSLLHLLYAIKKDIGDISRYDEAYRKLSERLESIYIELNDLADSLPQMADEVQIDTGKLEKNRERLSLLYDLFKKHGVNDLTSLLQVRQSLEEEIKFIISGDERLAEMRERNEAIQKELHGYATIFHRIRKEKSKNLEQQLIRIIRKLGMPDANFSFALSETDTLDAFGKTAVSLLFSANKGRAAQPVHKAASGGEMSRIMLAIKYVMTLHAELPALVLDEIDTGISGDIALKAARIMREMSKQTQLIAITHLPQIAASGNAHCKVYKETVQGKTFTRIKYLTDTQRISEIAEMLGGTPPSHTAIEHAKMLLSGGETDKKNDK